MEYCIAGHHTGLMDGGTVADNSDSPTLSGTLKRENEYTGENDYSAYTTEINFATLLRKKEHRRIMNCVLQKTPPSLSSVSPFSPSTCSLA